MKLVKDWRKAWRFFSVQADAVAIAGAGEWGAAPALVSQPLATKPVDASETASGARQSPLAQVIAALAGLFTRGRG